jgi:hypothetical protein
MVVDKLTPPPNPSPSAKGLGGGVSPFYALSELGCQEKHFTKANQYFKHVKCAKNPLWEILSPGKGGTGDPWGQFLGLGGLSEGDSQFVQLPLVHLGGCVSEGAGGPLGFRKGYHLSDGFNACHNSHQTVKTKSYACMGRCTIL